MSTTNSKAGGAKLSTKLVNKTFNPQSIAAVWTLENNDEMRKEGHVAGIELVSGKRWTTTTPQADIVAQIERFYEALRTPVEVVRIVEIDRYIQLCSSGVDINALRIVAAYVASGKIYTTIPERNAIAKLVQSLKVVD
jgi:hypothetical protein